MTAIRDAQLSNDGVTDARRYPLADGDGCEDHEQDHGDLIPRDAKILLENAVQKSDRGGGAFLCCGSPGRRVSNQRSKYAPRT
jgi:hypothetical protein